MHCGSSLCKADGHSRHLSSALSAVSGTTQYISLSWSANSCSTAELSINPLAARICRMLDGCNFMSFVKFLAAFSARATDEAKRRFLFQVPPLVLPRLQLWLSLSLHALLFQVTFCASLSTLMATALSSATPSPFLHQEHHTAPAAYDHDSFEKASGRQRVEVTGCNLQGLRLAHDC